MSKPISKRTLRRAAEREAQKAAQKLNALTALLPRRDQEQQVTTQTPEPQPQAQPKPDPTIPTPAEKARMEAVYARCQAHWDAQKQSRTSAAQIAANQANAQHSTGPTSPEGKATVSQNRRSHGLTGKFTLLPWEDRADHNALIDSVYSEYKPESETEYRLADSLIQHYWLMQRALHLQEQILLEPAHAVDVDNKRLALFMRYQATHERSYYKAQRELQNLQKQKRKEQIGFESQKRQQESLEAKTRLANARALTLEVDASCRQVMEAPIPGTHNIPFELITKACSEAISTLVFKQRMEDKHQTAA
jgi:hypothetical protein